MHFLKYFHIIQEAKLLNQCYLKISFSQNKKRHKIRISKIFDIKNAQASLKDLEVPDITYEGILSDDDTPVINNSKNILNIFKASNTNKVSNKMNLKASDISTSKIKTFKQSIYCICKSSDEGKMIQCDNEDDCWSHKLRLKLLKSDGGSWFHFSCVNFGNEDVWICSY